MPVCSQTPLTKRGLATYPNVRQHPLKPERQTATPPKCQQPHYEVRTYGMAEDKLGPPRLE